MTNHTAESELLYIKKIIDDSRQATLDNGKYYILWGVVVGIASILTYYGVKNKLEGNFINWVWMNCIITGWIFSFIFMFRDRKKERSKTFAGKMIGHTWLGAGITMAVIAFVGIPAKVIPYDAICPVIAAVAGGANYISSRLQKSGFILVVAIGWWVGSGILFYLNGIDVILAYGIMLSLFSIVPGIVLYYRWKKELSDESLNEVKSA